MSKGKGPSGPDPLGDNMPPNPKKPKKGSAGRTPVGSGMAGHAYKAAKRATATRQSRLDEIMKSVRPKPKGK